MTHENAITDIRSFNRFYTNIIGLINHYILESTYSLTEARILWEIAGKSDLNAREIVQKLQIDEGYLSRTIKKLTAEKLIEKKKSLQDSRVHSLYLTAKGEKIIAELNAESSAEIADLIKNLDDNEITDLVSSMNRITEILDREEIPHEDRN